VKRSKSQRSIDPGQLSQRAHPSNLENSDATLDAACRAANELTDLCDNLLRIARGEQLRGSCGYTYEELMPVAERICSLLNKARDNQVHLIDQADPVLPKYVPAVEVGGAGGSNFHRAVARLAIEIDGALISARLRGSLGKPDATFVDWWPLAAEVLSQREKVSFSTLVESLRSESHNAKTSALTNRTGHLAKQVVSQQSAHSPDFRSVQWFGVKHKFSTMQAACLKILWENWEQGTPEIAELTILDLAGSSSERLRDVFTKGKHLAWGTMIIGSGKGAFRLAEPKKAKFPSKTST
jgi:hypothetical protein